MPNKVKFKIKNWKLAILALVFISFFAGLGFWQLSRAKEKQLLFKSFAERTLRTPVFAKDLSNINDWRFYRVQLTGSFDNRHSFLLDNKIYKGKIGYEVYTPFIAHGMMMPILVDRGFIPMGTNRSTLPKIRDISGDIPLVGMLNLPPTYVALGQIKDSAHITWPMRIEYINVADMAKLLNTQLFPYILNMDPHDPNAYATEWVVTTMAPERHKGYAVQWFALALTLLILFVALNRTR